MLLFLGLAAQPAVNGEFPDRLRSPGTQGRGRDEVPAPFRGMAELASGLLNATTNTTDTDGDGLPDNVERALGTDWNNSDSDFDRVGDYDEVNASSDPNAPDSNSDGLADCFELDNVSADLDGDGMPNVWDWDNDGDGVGDALDLSPNARIPVASSLDLSMNTSGKPAYLTFQVRSARSENMKLMYQSWDWPADEDGSMQDLDGSKEDVRAVPMLELNCSHLPDAKELEDYGITVSGSCAFVPVLPVSELGDVVAMGGKMFFPGDGVPRNISVTARLVWTVTGRTDTARKALQAASGNYLSCDPGGNITSQDREASDNSTFDWMDFGNGRVAARTGGGGFLTVGTDGRLAASKKELGEEGVFGLSVHSGRVALLACNGKNLTEKADGTVYADGENLSAGQLFTVRDMGYRVESRALAKYYEDFGVTGFTAVESSGTDVAVVSGTNASQLVAAQLKLAYAFLRNASNDLGDIPSILSGKNITFEYASESCNHSDEALRAAATRLVPGALDALPENETLPLIIAMEDRYAGVELSQLWTGSRSARGPLAVDLAAEEVLNTRFLKMCWYNTSEMVPLDEWAIVEELRGWGLSNSSLTVLIGLTIAWSTGESCVVRIDQVSVNYYLPEINLIDFVVDNMITFTMESVGVLKSFSDLLDFAYSFIQYNKIEALLQKSGKDIWKVFGRLDGIVDSVKAGSMSRMGTVTKWIEGIGLAISVGLALWAMIRIGQQFGWTPTGTGIAVSYFILEVVYAVVLTVIACLGPVGAVISLLIAMSDLMAYMLCGEAWSQKLIETVIGWFIDWFSDIDVRSEVNLDAQGTDVEFSDLDGNGADVGDNITYSGRFVGNVTITSHGNFGDLVDSYIIPRFTAAAPDGSRSQSWSRTTNGTPDYTASRKSTTYETEATLKPGIGMVNFPIAIGLTTDYSVYYDDCWWAFKWWCDRENQAGSQSSHWTTMFYDIMPATISDFATWGVLRSGDWDGDGLNNSEENGTNTWDWDSDGDGLGDKYELQIGTDPRMPDSDGDGLNDRYELTLGSASSKRDSDGDGLPDYVEYTGWVISFDFCGKTFHWLVNSDPRFPDTDGDGIGDLEEYYCLLNPRSRDTDGDGTDDELKDYYRTFLEYYDTFEKPTGSLAGFSPYACALSPGGHLYVCVANTSTWTSGLVEYDPSGGIVNEWDLFCHDVEIDTDGNIYIAYYSSSGFIDKYDPNFTYIATYPAYIIQSLALDEKNGFMYISDSETGRIFKLLKSNGTKVLEWPSPGGGGHTGWGGMDVDADGRLLVPYLSSLPADYEDTILRYLPNGTLDRYIGGLGAGEGQFSNPNDVKVLPDGNLLVADSGNNRIQKLNATGHWIASFGSPGSNNSALNNPAALDFDENYIYVSDTGNKRVQKLSHEVRLVRVLPSVNFTDSDGDGLNDTDEGAGWNVTVDNETGMRAAVSYHVTSEPNLTDSDGDGLSDLQEFRALSDPRSVDTDQEGLPDAEEARLGTNLTNWDTDGDGLGDGTEPGFGSDPVKLDTDGEGLSDGQEMLSGSNPASADTDQDGLDDRNESLLGSGLMDPDSDDDFMFDGEEKQKGANPRSNDTDGDGLSDGYEMLYRTEPLSNDTDGDGLEDGFEANKRLDPLSSDTDGDGVPDGEELEKGLNPFSKDSDGDRVPDELDSDILLTLEDDIILVADGTGGLEAFASDLSREATVVRATPRELSEKYSAEPYIVLVGRPDAPEGTAGAVTGELLAGTGEVLQGMLESDIRHQAVRYGVWTATQTVVMLSSIHSRDAQAVIGILKSQKVTVTENSITVRYRNERSCIQLDDLDTALVTDSVVRAKLDEMAQFNVTVSGYDATHAPASLTYLSGLQPGELAMGKYLGIELSENIQGKDVDLLTGARIELYYSAKDLDRTGDGDADDPQDLDESTLSLYKFDGTSGNWSKLQAGLGGVNATGVNTTDITRYGTQYLGYIWADAVRLSLFGAGGKASPAVRPLVARAGDDIDLTAGEQAFFNGSLSSGYTPIQNFSWTFSYNNRTVALFGPVAFFAFNIPGSYAVTLTVRDSWGLTASDDLTVTVRERPDGKWTLRLGPVTDDNGTALEGALVNLTVGGASFSNTTDGLGMAQLELAPEHVGKSVGLTISKEGYLPVEYSTNITQERGLERSPPPLVKIKPGDGFTLGVGHVRDRAGKSLEGALVTITVGGKTYSNTTDANGSARFLLPVSMLGKNVSVKIEKEGYTSLSYDTKISADRALEQNPPAMEKVAKPSPEAGPPIALWVAVAAAVTIIVLAGALLLRRRRPGTGN